jgi:creatinine amidohydrolase
MRLLDMTTHEFAAARPARAFLATGTVEAHDLGPLGTDVLAPERLASDLAPVFGAVLLPTLPYGVVNSLSGYPGGMWMSTETYTRVLFEVLSSLAASRIESVIVFNGHGGNTAPLCEALPRVWKTTGIRTASIDWWTSGEDIATELFGSGGGHGGADELSVVLGGDPASLPAWDGSRAWRIPDGVKAWPSPASSIRYADGVSIPLTAESAAEYYRRLRDRIEGIVAGILAGWEAMP